jgi:hypothetical protein
MILLYLAVVGFAVTALYQLTTFLPVNHETLQQTRN